MTHCWHAAVARDQHRHLERLGRTTLAGTAEAEPLVRMAEEFEEDLDRQLRVLVSLAEPAMLFVMAAMVGAIVVGMLLPVFDLWDAIQ